MENLIFVWHYPDIFLDVTTLKYKFCKNIC